MTNDYRIIIATRDSAGWLAPVLEWYRQHHLEPLFIVDTRTRDATRQLINKFGFKFKEFLPRGDFPEAGMLEFGAEQSDADWILRLDDDELPNLSLLEWVRERGVKSKNQCWFITRRELFFHNNKIFYSRSLGKYPLARHDDKLHPVARLYHRKRVRFLEEIHTTGLEELVLYDFAPQQNFIIHFNCLIHSFKARVRKLEFYEKINPQLSWCLADEYLPELFSLEFHQAKEDGLEEFYNFFKNLIPSRDFVDLDDNQKEFILSSVKDRARGILKQRYQLKLGQNNFWKHISADDISWIENQPKMLRKIIVKILCTLLLRRNKNYANALWDYYELYKL